MLKSILRTPQFKRDYKAVMKKHRDEARFVDAVSALMEENKELLKTRYHDHALKGVWEGFRELHIEGDWLLVYRIEREVLQLVLARTGSHDKLF